MYFWIGLVILQTDAGHFPTVIYKHNLYGIWKINTISFLTVLFLPAQFANGEYFDFNTTNRLSLLTSLFLSLKLGFASNYRVYVSRHSLAPTEFRLWNLMASTENNGMLIIHLCPNSTGYLTHWGREEIDVILQTTLSNAFSWMKMY